MSISLRLVQPTDHEFLFSVYASTRADEMALVDWSEEQKYNFLRMQFEAQDSYYRENYLNAQFQIIQQNDEPMGRLYIQRRGDEIRIMDIALLPAYQKRGIGSRLLQEILEEGNRKNLPVTIHVERFNPAMKLYERLGFHRMEDKGVYYLMEWKPLIMEKSQSAG